jgi:peptidoglycan hydrolase-like protein with peptidoglycan-binding domain
MFRTIAVATALMTCSLGAGTLAAQSTAPAKPAPHAQKDTSAKATTSMAPKHSWSKAEITQAQQGLAKAGYYKGKPSGQLDADTKKALKAFEKANNMPATGRLTDSVYAKLKTA